MNMDEYGSRRMNLDEVSLRNVLILYPESNRSGSQARGGMRKERTKVNILLTIKIKKDESEI